MVAVIKALAEGRTHVCCNFCGWHSIGYYPDDPGYVRLEEWKDLHEATCPSDRHRERLAEPDPPLVGSPKNHMAETNLDGGKN